MSKSKKADVDVAIANKMGDRYKSNYLSWEQFVIANFPVDKYPDSRKTYLQ